MSDPLLTIKEQDLRVLQKMDAVNLTGVWLNFPAVTTPSGRLKAAAGFYLSLMEMEARRKKRKKESKGRQRRRLLEEVEKRIVQMDNDDMVMILGL